MDPLSLASQGNKGAQAWIAQIKSAPDQNAQAHHHEIGIADSQMGGNGPSQIPGEQNCAKDRSPGNDIDDGAG